jgi:uncharacterized protein YfiM (DUF2279 family)
MRGITWVVAVGVSLSVTGASVEHPSASTRAARLLTERPALAQPQTSAGAEAPAFGPTIDAERLRRAEERLVRLVQRLPAQVSLADLVRTALGAAADPSPSSQVVEDHRSTLLALTFYVNGWGLQALVPEARTWPRPARRNVLLRGRHDLSQHFTVSALIAAYAGTAVANAAGVYKEMDDARRGSGFSFSDLAADRAGTMFGEMATRSSDSARRLRALVGAGLTEDDMMLVLANLPDNLSEAEFMRRFGGVGAPAYNQLVGDIDRRVAALALFQ